MGSPPDIFTKRGITPPWEGGAVARAQGFIRYEGADWRERRAIVAEVEWLYGQPEHPSMFSEKSYRAARDTGRPGTLAELRAEEERYKSGVSTARKSPRAWTAWLREALASDGWLMPRNAVMPNHEDSSFSHDPVAQLRPDVPAMGHPVAHAHSQFRSRRDRHELKVCDLGADGEILPTGHLHPLTGELVVPLEGRHRHWTHAKYLYTPGSSALRLGTNPVALERGWGDPDDLFVVVLEGTLKMCAVVEAGYPALDAGSVTLWHGAAAMAELNDEGHFEGGMVLELEEFAGRHLKGRRVAVVCDSDWAHNPLVFNQTQQVVSVLERAGARAVGCAPPDGRSLGWRHPIKGEMRDKRGVDDWLGEHEPCDRHDALLELECLVRVGDGELTADHPSLKGRRDGRETTADVARAIGEAATPEGLALYSERGTASQLGRDKKRVQAAKHRAVDAGLLEPVADAEKRMAEDGSFFMMPPLLRVAPEARPRYDRMPLRRWLTRA